MLDPLDIARFTTAQAAQACGISPGALAAILHRGAVALAGDEPAETRNPGSGPRAPIQRPPRAAPGADNRDGQPWRARGRRVSLGAAV